MATLTQFQIFENPAKQNKLCVMHTNGTVGVLEGAEEGGTTTADRVTFTPPSGMVSTNVQNAVTENFNNKIANSSKGVANGVASLDSNGKVPVTQLPDEFKAMLTVPTYSDLPTTGLYDGMNVFVTDATGDPTVTRGWAIYKYTLSQTLWVKIAEGESLDIILSWANILNKPSVFPPESHTHSESEVTGLVSDLSTITGDITTINNTLPNKSNVGHTHAQSDVTGLESALSDINDELDTKSDIGHTHGYLPLSGGTLTGDLHGTNATFANVSSDLTGNASSSTKLQTARNITIKDNEGSYTGSTASFDGSSDITLNLPANIKADILGNVSGSSSSCTGNASTATTASSVTGIFTVRINNGSVEDTTRYTYNGSSDKSLNIVSGTNITFSTSANTLTINSENTVYTPGDGIDITNFTVTNTGVRSVTEGSTNGTISVNTNGTTSNIPVHGLGSAAYTDSTDYATASHTHPISDVNNLQTTLDNIDTELETKSDVGHTHEYLPLAGGTLTGTLTGTDATFNTVTASLTGNASTASTLQTSRTINISDHDGSHTGTGISFDGSVDTTIKLPDTIKADILGSSSSCTGNSNTATTASAVSNSMTIKIDNGTVEGSTKYTYNGSAAKTLNIVGGTNVTLSTSADTLTINSANTIYTQGTGISINDYVITNTGVLSVVESNVNGNISVNTNGNTVNVSVHGLGSAAYTDTSTYAPAVHTHSYLPLSGGTLTGDITGTNATFTNVTSNLTGNADTSDKWSTERTITISDSDGTNTGAGVSLDGSSNVTLKLPSTIKATVTDTPVYGTCSTAGSTLAKEVTLANFVLYTGARITVKFTNANTVDYPTLNVNSTGARNIVAQNANLTTASNYNWEANNVIDFVYDGTSWVIPNNAITLGENVVCITNAVFEGETLRFYSPDTIKYNINTVTAADSISIPISKPLCKIVNPSTTPSTAPTNTITISGTPVEGQMLIVANTSSYDAQGSGLYIPSKEIQKYLCIDPGDGTLVWWSIGYGRIMLA